MYLYFPAIVIFLLGLCIGSFLNVCIFRLPISKSIVQPGSMCPNCGTPIKFYDNFPVLSYLLLKGSCRNCKVHIPIRYPLVEILSAFLALCVFIKYGMTFQSIIYYFFISLLIIITFIDIDHRIIPDIITIPGIPVFLTASFAMPISFLDSILGVLTGGGSLFLVAWGYHLITKKEGMGGGDIKLLAMIGAVIGWKGVIFTIFVASFIGTLTGIVLILLKKKDLKLAVPFGPFLSMAGITYIFFGPQLINWYFNLLI